MLFVAGSMRTSVFRGNWRGDGSAATCVTKDESSEEQCSEEKKRRNCSDDPDRLL